jgi:8-oxo-dGTP pyrophosphatase MutT (NUDIX family)
MTSAVPGPSPAATVLLLRDGARGIEVLMQRRRASLSFMGGMWVYPGGRHETADRAVAVLERVRAASGPDAPRMHDLAGHEMSREETLGLYVTACRETFEECGVLLATDTGGTPVFAAPDPHWTQWRNEVATRAEAFADLLIGADLYLDVHRLVYWSRPPPKSGGSIRDSLRSRYPRVSSPGRRTRNRPSNAGSGPLTRWPRSTRACLTPHRRRCSRSRT